MNSMKKNSTMKGVSMNIYRKASKPLFFLLLAIVFSVQARSDHRSTSSEKLDLMVDFAYPISMIQSVRYDVSQALYFSQQQDLELVASLLQNALSKLASRNSIDDDDRDYIQQMINQIDALIKDLEKKDKSGIILDLCQQIQDRL